MDGTRWSKTWSSSARPGLENTGNVWDEKEEILLKMELKSGMTIDAVAANHKRTSKAIELRIDTIVRQMMSRGMQADAIAAELGISVGRVEETKKTDRYDTNGAMNYTQQQLVEMNRKLDAILEILSKK